MAKPGLNATAILIVPSFIPKGQWVTGAWPNPHGDKLNICKSRIWARVSPGGAMYVHCDFRRESDPRESAMNILQWDHYAIAGNQFNGFWLDYEPTFILDAEEKLMYRYYGDSHIYRVEFRIDIQWFID